MLKKFLQFISDNQLFDIKNDTVLLGVSGGPDSVVMADLFFRAKIRFEICHVNFNLRGEDSVADMEFVKNLCEKYSVHGSFYSVDTKEYARKNKLSIEMAARDFRYSKFEEISLEKKIPYIAVAHHGGDAVETFLLNLTRGAGLKGLTGIRVKNGKIIRPLLCFSRYEIMDYIEKQGLSFRTDKTNFENDYTRNKIRNQIIPLFETINPSFKNNVALTMKFLSGAEKIYENAVSFQREKIIKKEDGFLKINISDIEKFCAPEILLFEICSAYGFNRTQTDEIFLSLSSQSGKLFYSSGYQILKDRKELIISELKPQSIDSQIEITISDVISGGVEKASNLEFTIIENKDFSPQRDVKTVYYDFNEVVFPLKISLWHSGDVFLPFGANGKKKISDLLTDKKLNLVEKQRVRVLRSGEKIIWVIGLRASNYFRVTDKTKKILKITLIE